MRRAAELADLGYGTLVKTAKRGMRGYEVVAEIEHAIRLEGADFVQFWLISGPSEGWKDTWPIVRPHERQLDDGDQIICGSYVVYKGYWAHGMRVGTLGKPSPQQERYMPVCMGIHHAAMNAIKPGAKVSQVVKEAISAGRSKGVKLSSTRIGHGIGMDYSEMPFMIEENDQELRPGMVIVIHPQVTLPETGGFIVPLGDVCLVTDTGMERLMRFPMEPFIA
jgi:Xaa-Pro dipeptidase